MSISRKIGLKADSAKIERPHHDPIASTVSAADDRIVMSEWVPPQEGTIPRTRDFADLGAGQGGYNEDHEFYGYRMPI